MGTNRRMPCHIIFRSVHLTLNRVHNKMKQAARERIIFYCTAKGSLFCYTLYRVAHEKPDRRLVDQRGRRSRTLYRELNKCKCRVLTG